MRNIPVVTKNLLIINIIAYVATLLMEASGVDLNSLLGMHFFMAREFHLW